MHSLPLFLLSISPIVLGFLGALYWGKRNIENLAAQADVAWKNVQEARMELAESAERLVDALRMNPAKKEHTQALAAALERCRAATNPPQAAASDDNLLRAVAASHAEKADQDALAEVVRADDAIAQKRQIFNNLAVTHNNAGKTFPALLVAKAAGYTPYNTYEPEIASGAKADRERATHATLSDTTKVMNAYMLWAVSMGGSTETQPTAAKACN
ncbi:MAG: hypothetical protein Q4C41_01655 [Eggerthellaceae bacterium]|nr:hypothetical protein [Eggerthellaceae bacterium]